MIYLDGNATSRLRPAAAEAVRAFLTDCPIANPSSVHLFGRKARAELTRSRETIARFFGLTTDEVGRLLFTSGATEACATLIYGFAGSGAGHAVVSAIEHPAVLEPTRALRERGWTVDEVLPDSTGTVHLESLLDAVRPDTRLVGLMAANNETGALQPVRALAERLRRDGYSGAIVCDYTQIPFRAPISPAELLTAGVDGLAFSGHKCGALPGVGGLILAGSSHAGCRLFSPLLVGGGQEEGFRGGTENLLGIVSLAAALSVPAAEIAREMRTKRSLRERLWALIKSECPDSERLGPIVGSSPHDGLSEDGPVLVNTLLCRIPGCRADDLVVALDLEGVAVSAGSACSSGKQGVSHVVQAMGLSPESAREAVRFSLDWGTTPEEIDAAAAILGRVVARSRG